MLRPTAGTARVCGHDVRKESLKAKRALGYLPEGAPSYGELTVREFLTFIVRSRGLPADQGFRRFEEVVGHLQLEEVLDTCIETLSKGLRRRVGLAQAIVHNPPVLMLDEPTDGLDPNQKHAVRQLIDTMARERTILISTHLLEEVHALCNRVVIIANGRLLADATPAELEARSRYHGAVSFSAQGSGISQEMLGRLPQVAGIEVDPLDGRVTVFRKPSNNSNGNTFDFQGRELSCEHGTRRVVRYEHDGSVTVLADKWNGKRFNAPNDIVVHPNGDVWFTDPGAGLTAILLTQRLFDSADPPPIHKRFRRAAYAALREHRAGTLAVDCNAWNSEQEFSV